MTATPPEAGPDPVRCPLLAGTPHGFFTRAGGVSAGPYASLNGSTGGGDDPSHVAANRARVAASLGVAPGRLLGLTQVHGRGVAVADAPWAPGAGPRADAAVTRVPGLALVIVTADCAPVLLHDAEARVAGAAHAGWRGAVAGVLEETVAAMARLGADRARIRAAVGPCIQPWSYEVRADMRDAALSADGAAVPFFSAGAQEGSWMFDLPAYCGARLRAAGVGAVWSADLDTLADEARFFSHRRRTRAGGGPIGHQMSGIAP